MRQQPSLFSALDLPEPPRTKSDGAKVLDSAKIEVRAEKARMIMAHRVARCADVLGAIERGTTTHVVSATEWSSHDIITHALTCIGPADLWCATFAITEDALRALLVLRDRGQILTINAVVDERLGRRAPTVWQLLRAQADRMRVYACHAKTYILRNAEWGFSIVSSANLTNNPRIEVATVTENAEVADFHIGWMTQILEKIDPFEPPDGAGPNEPADG